MKRREFISGAAMGAVIASPASARPRPKHYAGFEMIPKGDFADAIMQDWLVAGNRVITSRSRRNIVVLNRHKRKTGEATCSSHPIDGFGHGHGLGQFGDYLYIGASEKGFLGVRLFKLKADGAVISNHFYRVSNIGPGTAFPAIGNGKLAIRTKYPHGKMRMRVFDAEEFFGDPSQLTHTVDRRKLAPLHEWGFSNGPNLQGLCWYGSDLLTLSGRRGGKARKYIRHFNVEGKLIDKIEINTGVNWAASKSPDDWELEGMHFIGDNLHVGVGAGRRMLGLATRKFRIMPVF